MTVTAAGAAVVSADRLQVTIGTTSVLRDVSLSVAEGEMVAVMGPSGSGKSTLLHCLAGLLVSQSGVVRFCGDDMSNLGERARARLRLRRMGFVFQFGELVPELTLVENVELPLLLTGVTASDARRRALAWLERLGVDDVADRRLVEVSGGQAQRVAVARALVHRPAVVFADEPTGALDTLAGESVMEALTSAATETGAAVVIVTHELRVASYAAREVNLLDGALIPDAATESTRPLQVPR